MTKITRSHWSTRAEDYRLLLRGARTPEVRQVLEHLERICSELAKVEKSVAAAGRSWMDPFTRSREHAATRWRMRQAAYLAMAKNAGTEDARYGWQCLAGRVAELADYLEATRPSGGSRAA